MSKPLPLITPTHLGSVLQASRKAQGITQSALAGRLSLSQSRVSHLELHPQELSVEQLLSWAAALGLELTIGSRGDPASSSTPQTDW